MRTSYYHFNDENIIVFCVTAAKNTTTTSQAAFSPFLTLEENNLCVFDGKWQRSRQYPAKYEAASFPSWPTEKASFLLLSARLRRFSSRFAQTTPIKSGLISLTLSCRQHVSSRFLKGQSGYTWQRWWYSLRCGNIVVGRDCGAESGGASPDGRSGAVRQPEVTLWSQTGLSKPGWDSRYSLIH